MSESAETFSTRTSPTHPFCTFSQTLSLSLTPAYPTLTLASLLTSENRDRTEAGRPESWKVEGVDGVMRRREVGVVGQREWCEEVERGSWWLVPREGNGFTSEERSAL